MRYSRFLCNYRRQAVLTVGCLMAVISFVHLSPYQLKLVSRSEVSGCDIHSNDRITTKNDVMESAELKSYEQGMTPDDNHTDIPATRHCTQEERLIHLNQVCAKQNNQTNNHKVEGSFIIDQKHRLVYCPLAKVGCTSWKILLAYATGNEKALNSSWPPVHNRKFLHTIGLSSLSDFSQEQRIEVFTDYFNFLVVRHPFDRLISAWRDKLVMKNSPYRRSLGRRILARYRNSTNNFSDPEWNTTATFAEFVEYLSEYKSRDQHWRPYNSGCSVCSVRYDAVIRTETTQQDTPIIMEKLPDYKVGKVPLIHSHQNNTEELFKPVKQLKEFQGVTQRAYQHLFERYGNDMELFGYTWNPDTLTAGCAIPTADGKICC